MPETFIYLPLVGYVPQDLKAGTNILIQVFIDPETNQVISAHMATRPDTWDTWGVPTKLEAM
jgi:adenosyl cobinamide kinase/adenosyl cobinamide phosphate guanylyltransferase